MLLLYCMTQDDVPLRCDGWTGIDGAAVRDATQNGVRYFYSDWQPAKDPEKIKAQALEFHRVNQRIFEHATLIPFRFPTSIASEKELSELIQATSSDYSQELQRLRGMVQMKISVESPPANAAIASTGTEYLKQRQRATAPIKEMLAAVAHIIRESKQSHHGNQTILDLLLQRDQIGDLRPALSALKDLPQQISLSGPWPPSEFVNCYPDLPSPGTQAKE